MRDGLRRWRVLAAAPFLAAAGVLTVGYVAAVWAAGVVGDLDPLDEEA